MLGRVMSVRACQLAGLFRQRLLVTSAVHRAHVPGAPAAASGVCRTRLRRTPKLLRETAGCRLLSTDGATFGRSGVAARASRASEASTSGGEDAPEPDAVGGRPSAPATGAPAAPLSASDESSVEGDSDDKQEGSGGEEGGPRRPGKPAAPEKRILKVPTPRGMKELLMVGNVIVEPSLAEMIEPAENQRVTQSEYVQSCVSLAQCPPPKFPEFAFIGRSNVGKSSIINLITNRKQLAMVSKTPGKTQTINHFKVVSGSSGPWYLVDLPGYGFAKAPGDTTKQWAKFTQEYFLKRESLVSVMLLVDGSIPPQAADLEVADWLGENGVPFSIVFTKIDKKRKVRPGKRTNAMENVEQFQFDLGQTWLEFPPMVLTSSTSGAGKQELGNHIAYLRNRWKKGGMRRAVPPPAAAKAGAAPAKKRGARGAGGDGEEDDGDF